ncbi:ATP-binding cassette domain-containing protein [Georgenia sp. TF02-10]|uniref:methionine ABC transporter ATP-binding protein n=1 Tax=Georgenia sp. TF02-10 TaxID=2917725 RepID=UPI001FA71A50|nr:ATP-binding cassette domain-containing protein [Georgenia sp. TF02-10]UNX54756.1 ATP-binding cassette domain-containing protein [Georgenia sp. TF02-10]
MIDVVDVSKTFAAPGRQVRALDRVDLHVSRGEVFGIVGQSGAGKSTLVRTVNALERPDTGTVSVDGEEISALDGAALRRARRRTGMIFQHFNLLASRTVRGNVELALEIAGQDRRARRRRAGEILELVGLAEQAGAYPAQLSGGQKQRVGIARALATEPAVLLSDEATSALDPETTRAVLDLIKSLSASLGLTVLLITHEMDVIKRVCDSAAVMADGRVLEQGPVDALLTTPGSRLAAELFQLGSLPPERGTTIVDITFTRTTASRPVVAQLARRHGLDVTILGAAVETIHDGAQTGRTRLEIPGTPEQVRAAVEDLRGQGLFVEVVR